MKVGLLTLLCSVSILLGKAQQVQRTEIKGRVLNSTDRSPVSNANIHVINKQQVTRTDDKGVFVLSGIVDRDSLAVSSVGYKSRTVAGFHFRDNAVILLQKEDYYLQEVQVSTGYQTLRSNEVTGAINVISRKMLDQQVGTNILQRLNNVVPAVRFDNQPIKNGMQQKLNVSVRGLSTINGNLDPLIVLDGFIYEGDITNIDPAMIESATVLKDAAASAIWGARAGNGVIVLTTKKGILGADTRNKITFGSTMIFKDRPNLSQLY
ncbi:TonB-dependent receptor plug domain-containing protein, partial [Sphingobacterium sp.]|uniref:TonB-dependent receptor plug domain-containing protein n=1 Tax=Sphingobacterium sp. TaxID=341027 RepID=UPI00289FA6BE